MPIINIRTADAKMLDISFFTGPAKRVLSRARRPDAGQVIVVLGGVYMAHIDTPLGRQRIRARAGDVVYWPAGSEDTEESEAGSPLRCLSLFLNWPGSPAGLPFMVRDADGLIGLLAGRLLALAHGPVRRVALDAAADAFLAVLLTEYVSLAERTEDGLVSRVIRYVEEHIRSPIRLAELARHVGLEKNHFGRKYRQLTGRSPIQDVRRRKAVYAKQILQLAPRRPLAEVARLVGVRDAPKLSRLLAQYIGLSAREIKRAARARRGASS